MRAFVIGVTLLVLLFGGFAVGIEAGTHPRTLSASTIEVSGTVGTTVVTQKVNSRVITVQGQVVTLPGTTTTKVVRVIVVRDHRGRVHYYLQPASTSSSGVPLARLHGSADPVPYHSRADHHRDPDRDRSPHDVTETQTVTETAPPTTTGTSNPTTTTP